MSRESQTDLLILKPSVSNLTLEHPLYDNFGALLDVKTAREYLKISAETKIVIFGLSETTKGWI